MRTPRGYLEHAGTPRAIGGDDAIEAAHVPFEFMLNALRLNRGFSLAQFSATTGLDATVVDAQVAAACARGWLVRSGERVQTTEFGRRFLNDVIGAFLPDVRPAAGARKIEPR